MAQKLGNPNNRRTDVGSALSQINQVYQNIKDQIADGTLKREDVGEIEMFAEQLGMNGQSFASLASTARRRTQNQQASTEMGR